jgi:Flp pilus assembly protein TadB
VTSWLRGDRTRPDTLREALLDDVVLVVATVLAALFALRVTDGSPLVLGGVALVVAVALVVRVPLYRRVHRAQRRTSRAEPPPAD